MILPGSTEASGGRGGAWARLAIMAIVCLLSGLMARAELPLAVNVSQLVCGNGSTPQPCVASEAVPEPVIWEGGRCRYVDAGRQEAELWFDACDTGYTRGLARVCSKKGEMLACGLMSRSGDIVIPLLYEDIRWNEDSHIASVRYMQRWGFYNLTERRLLVAPQFVRVHDFRNGLAVVIEEGPEGSASWIVNQDGIRIAPIPEDITLSGRFGLARMDRAIESGGGEVELSDSAVVESRTVSSTGGEDQDTWSIMVRLIPARHANRWGFLNERGEWHINPQFHHAHEFFAGLAPVRYSLSPEFWAVVDGSGRGRLIFEGTPHQLDPISAGYLNMSVGCSQGQHQVAASCMQFCLNPQADSSEELCF